MPEKSEGGWLSAVGRLFSSSSAQAANPVANQDFAQDGVTHNSDGSATISNGTSLMSSPAALPGRSLRYLSPSSVRSKTEAITSAITEAVSRKRAHVDDRDGFGKFLESTVPVSPTTNSVKRFRGPPLANQSLIEEPLKVTTDRLDCTWAGGTSFMSPSSSVVSLRGRISDTASTTSSGLSSRTRAILEQLEKVHTPAKDIRRLPLIRNFNSTSSSEKWLPLSSLNDSAPPKKSMNCAPTRIQMLATYSGTRSRKPYWRDIVRKTNPPTNKHTKDVRSEETGEKVAPEKNELHPLFEVVVERNLADTDVSNRESGVLKGVDGGNVLSATSNKFSAAALDAEEQPLPLPESVNTSMISAPPSNFLGSFTFSPPKQRGPRDIEMEKTKTVIIDDSDDDSSDDGSGSESSEISSTDDELDKEKSPARPATSTDTETNATDTPPSFKGDLPMVTKESGSSKWSCKECFVKNDGDVQACIACTTPRSGSGSVAPAPSKQLVSNIASLASLAPQANFVFGAPNTGVSNGSLFTSKVDETVTTNTPSSKLVTAKTISIADVKTEERWSCKECFIMNEGTASKCVACGTANSKTVLDVKADEARAPWACPDCFISNKEDKCVACGYVKYKSESNSSSTANAFSINFKPGGLPATSVSGSAFKFGFGSTSASTTNADGSSLTEGTGDPPASSSISTITFGFGSSGVSDKASNSGHTTQPPFAFGTTSSGSASTTFTTKSESTPTSKSLFSSLSSETSTLTNGGSLPISTEPQPSASITTATSLAPKKPLFGASAQVGKLGMSFLEKTPASNTSVSDAAASTGSSMFGASSSLGLGTQQTTASSLPSNPFTLGTSNSLAGSSLFPSSLVSAPAAAETVRPQPTPSIPLFGTNVAATSGASSLLSFGATATTSSAAAPLLSFGTMASAPTGSSKGLFDTSSPAPFSLSSTGSSASASITFGNSAPKIDEVTPAKQSFLSGSFSNLGNATNLPNPFGNNGNGIKASSSTSSLGLFGNSAAPAATASLTGSSSATSLFSPPSEAPSSFNFGSSASGGNTGSGLFVFGGNTSTGANPAAPAPSSFGLGSNPFTGNPGVGSFGTPGSNSALAPSFQVGGAISQTGFGYSGSTGGASRPARKMISARRRKP